MKTINHFNILLSCVCWIIFCMCPQISFYMHGLITQMWTLNPDASGQGTFETIKMPSTITISGRIGAEISLSDAVAVGIYCDLTVSLVMSNYKHQPRNEFYYHVTPPHPHCLLSITLSTLPSYYLTIPYKLHLVTLSTLPYDPRTYF